MTITISPEAEEKLRQSARAEGLSVEAYIEQLVSDDEEWGERDYRTPIVHLSYAET